MNVGEKNPRDSPKSASNWLHTSKPALPRKKKKHYLSSKHTFLDNGPFGQSYFQLNYAGFSSQPFFQESLILAFPSIFVTWT